MGGEEVGPVQRGAGEHERVVGASLLAEVEALLAVGPAGRHLVADREPAPPRRAAAGHRHLGLDVVREGEERPRRRRQSDPQAGGNAVAGDAHEADPPAGLVEGAGDVEPGPARSTDGGWSSGATSTSGSTPPD